MTSEEERARMVELQLANRGISDRRVLEAFRSIPREAFVPPDLAEFAYRDAPLPIVSVRTVAPRESCADARWSDATTRHQRPGTEGALDRSMRLQDIMSRDIKTIGPGADAAQARAAMRMNRVRHLVVTEGRGVVGIISERDLGGRATANGRATQGLTVGDLMSGNVVTAKPDATVRQAANLLRGHIIGCLVVCDDGKPIGIVTTTDLLDLLGRGAERPVERATRRTLSARGPRGARPSLRHARRG